jgi:Mlc titration factor MtfA (ptsG expression regulator)
MSLFEWWRERRREKLLEVPFSPAHRAVLEHRIKRYRSLDAAQQQHLRDMVQVFIAEKNWEGCGGLRLTDEMKVIIAAQACLLVLELPHRLYENVDSILVYPSAVLRPEQRAGIFMRQRELVSTGATALLGEAQLHGSVVLAWDRVLRDTTYPYTGHNLVYHEFAHQLDMLDGDADGTPPLASREERQRWREVCERTFHELRARVAGSSGYAEDSGLDAYGATNEAEFFAVATEHFFDRPRQLREAEPALYDVLMAFYRQDPARDGVE